MSTKGTMVRGADGRFVKGRSGNALGRPKGSKNVITLQKLALEEVFRDETQADVLEVLKMVVAQAKDGDKPSQKLIWDASVSKQAIGEDKAAGNKQEIKVRTMNVGRGEVIEGEFDVETIKETS